MQDREAGRIALNSFRSFPSNKPYSQVNLRSIPANLVGNNCTLETDYTKRWRDTPDSIKIKANSGTPYYRADFYTTQNILGISEIDLVVYIEDVTKVTQIQMMMMRAEGGNWNRSVSSSELRNGWNILRFYAYQGTFGNWDNFTAYRVYFYTSAATVFYISKVVAIIPNKARLLFVNDHGYSNFKNNAYPHLKALGIRGNNL